MNLFKLFVSAALTLAVVAVYVDDSPNAGRRPAAVRREARRAARADRRTCHGSPAPAAPSKTPTTVNVTTGG